MCSCALRVTTCRMEGLLVMRLIPALCYVYIVRLGILHYPSSRLIFLATFVQDVNNRCVTGTRSRSDCEAVEIQKLWQCPGRTEFKHSMIYEKLIQRTVELNSTWKRRLNEGNISVSYCLVRMYTLVYRRLNNR
ncbi:hypothetical protein CLF_109525 [Clonorchis sinensis]|uniref:Uncharacterized protein n=1 Tax=Clonorchis sinensis TaxID=79923 RepID=G7YJG2_CLOSI|nr:hypothetical protein CLF_109525 [Clonorchis sinensis]